MKEGEIMSFQDIQKVTETEQGTRAKKAEAQAEAKQIVAAAEKAGAQLVADARAKAVEQTRAMMTRAEEAAQEQTKLTLEANNAACQAMRRQAQGRLDEAADLIVRRVVNL
jgi:flagellar biosynthesis/type III secretory pathway protein FliH